MYNSPNSLMNAEINKEEESYDDDDDDDKVQEKE
jgi:hypothetical protein